MYYTYTCVCVYIYIFFLRFFSNKYSTYIYILYRSLNELSVGKICVRLGIPGCVIKRTRVWVLTLSKAFQLPAHGESSTCSFALAAEIVVYRLLTVWEVGSARPTLSKSQLYFQEGRTGDGESFSCYSLFSLQPDCLEGHANRIHSYQDRFHLGSSCSLRGAGALTHPRRSRQGLRMNQSLSWKISTDR